MIFAGFVLRNYSIAPTRARQMFVMQATRHRSDAHPEGLVDPTTGRWCRGRHDETGLVGE